MKNKAIYLIPFVPFVLGYIVNLTALLPFGTILLFYVAPVVTAVFWYNAGKIYAREFSCPVKAILASHSVGILSLIIYVWQFLLTSDERRNIPLAVLSQMFFTPVMWISGRIINLFSSVYRVFFGAPTIHLWMAQIISLAIMIIIFYAGYKKEKP